MNALSEEQNTIEVEYAAEAIIPRAVYPGMTIIHERILLDELEQGVAQPNNSTIKEEK